MPVDTTDPLAPPTPPHAHLLICPACGRTLALDRGADQPRIATGQDTKDLSDAQKQALRALRPKTP